MTWDRFGRPQTPATREKIRQSVLARNARLTDPQALHPVARARMARRPRMSQPQLCEQAGIGVTTLRRIEHDQPVGDDVLAKVRRVLPEAFD